MSQVTDLLTSAANTIGFTAGAAATFSVLPLLRDDLGEIVTALETNALHAEGATTLVLRRAASAALRGELPARCKLTIAGTDYTTTASAVPSPSAGTLTVVVTPGLAASAAESTAVTVAAGSISASNTVKNSAWSKRYPERLQEVTSFTLMVPADQVPGKPAKGWQATAGGETGAVVEAAARDGHYLVFVGSTEGRRGF